MKRAIVSVGACFLIGSGAAAIASQPGYPQAQQDIVEAGMRIVLDHPQADWTGVGGPEDGDKHGPRMDARDGRSAEEMRANSAWAQHGGMSAYQGVGGPEVDEETHVYPPCRSRSDDRCKQGR